MPSMHNFIVLLVQEFVVWDGLQGYLAFGMTVVSVDGSIGEKTLVKVKSTDGRKEHGLFSLRETPIVGIDH